MAIIQLTYCNASYGREITVDYNDVAHTVDAYLMSEGSCSKGDEAGFVIYQQVDNGLIYRVRTQNGPPFAYVTAEDVPECLAVITDIQVTNATDDQTSDGAILIVAQSSGTIRYSINGGVTFQSSNVFNNLAGGTYNIVVRTSDFLTGFCTDMATATVGFDEVDCNIALGNITTQPSEAGSNGSITINTISNPAGLAVEYRIGAGVWQDSPVFTGLAAGTHNVQVRYKDYISCIDDEDVIITDDGSCDIFIQAVNVTHEQGQFESNGIIRIIATSTNGAIEYSKDNGSTWQDEDTFSNLAPGVYNLRVRDAASCIDSKTIELLPYKAPYFKFPIVNGFRFVPTAGPGIDYSNDPQNFDNKLFRDMRNPGVTPGEYFNPLTLSDSFKYQWRSNYSSHTVTIKKYSDRSTVAAIPCQMVKDFTRQVDSRTCYIADRGANLSQIFFESGLPDWAVVGRRIVLSGTGEGVYDDVAFEIMDLDAGTLAADGYAVIIIQATFPTTGLLNGSVDVEYDIELFDVWEFLFDGQSLTDDEQYYLLIEGEDDQFVDLTAESEPIQIAESHDDTILVKYKNTDNAYLIFYDTEIEHLLRIPGDLSQPQPGGEETNHEDSSNRFIKLHEVVTRNPLLQIAGVPPYIAEKLSLICGHDSVIINGVQYGKQDEKVEVTFFHDQGDPLCNAQVKLRQIDFTAENTDDAGDVDTPTLLEVNGVFLTVNPEL